MMTSVPRPSSNPTTPSALTIRNLMCRRNIMEEPVVKVFKQSVAQQKRQEFSMPQSTSLIFVPTEAVSCQDPTQAPPVDRCQSYQPKGVPNQDHLKNYDDGDTSSESDENLNSKSNYNCECPGHPEADFIHIQC
ncbi:hypothetical protein PSTT_05600, partial [Puccinia striiformis]